MEAARYLHLKPGDAPPRLEGVAPFRALVIIECDVSPQWRDQVSDWLVHSGCRYMLAWGLNCSDWDDNVDESSLALPENDLVMTTWHANDSLEETFRFCQTWAKHPSLHIERTYLVHISPEGRGPELLKAFSAAQDGSN